jgi:hypothetical protein
MKPVKPLIWIVIHLFLLLTGLAAQPVFQIQDILVDSKGLTGRMPVLIKTEMSTGTNFDSIEALESYIAEKKQLLDNTRLFNEVSINYVLLDQSDGIIPVLITVNIKETWNLIVLPYGKYDNNTGLTLSLRLRDYNFLGTMETLSLNINYILYDNNEDKSEYSAELSYKYNFRIGPQTLSLTLDQAFYYFTFSGDSSGEEPYYLSTGLKLATFFPTPVLVLDRDRLNYKVSVFADTNYNMDGFDFQEDDDLKKMNLGIAHGLSVSRINWTENYRNGYLFDIEQKYYHNFITDQLDINTSLEIAYHMGQYPLQFSTRMTGTLRGFSTADLGGNLRGIMDANVEGMGGVFWNNNLLLTIFRLPPVMEMQAGLILDLGYAFGLTGGSEFQSPLYTGMGFEIIAYPYFSKSLFLRASIAFNLEEVWNERSLSGEGNYEIFIGLGHYF